MFRRNINNYAELNMDPFASEDKRENGAGRLYMIKKKDRVTRTIDSILMNKNKNKNNNGLDNFNDLQKKYYINLCINTKNYMYVEFIKR